MRGPDKAPIEAPKTSILYTATLFPLPFADPPEASAQYTKAIKNG